MVKLMTHPVNAVRTILVPMDLSGKSVKALSYALRLARESRAAVVVLHTVQLNIAGEEFGIPRTRLLGEMSENARAELQRLLVYGVPSRIIIVEGRPAKEILDQAGKINADLIVMAAHKHRSPLHFLHPNTLQHVLEHACCPVVVVGPEEHEMP